MTDERTNERKVENRAVFCWTRNRNTMSGATVQCTRSITSSCHLCVCILLLLLLLFITKTEQHQALPCPWKNLAPQSSLVGFFWTPCVIYYIIYYLQGVLVPLVAVPGLLGNMLSIAILRSNNIDMKVIDQPWHHHQHLSASTSAVSA